MKQLDDLKEETPVECDEDHKAYRPPSGSVEVVTIVPHNQFVAEAYKRGSRLAKKPLSNVPNVPEVIQRNKPTNEYVRGEEELF